MRKYSKTPRLEELMKMIVTQGTPTPITIEVRRIGDREWHCTLRHPNYLSDFASCGWSITTAIKQTLRMVEESFDYVP